MAISILTAETIYRGRPGEKSVQTLTQSTATLMQNVNLFVHSIVLGMGTSTGFERNLYRLATDVPEGQAVQIYSTGTGEAYLLLQAGTATAMWVFSRADDFMKTEYWGDKWWVIYTSATLASST